LKYTLPEEITRNRTKATTQNFINIRISDFFVFGQEKILDFDQDDILKRNNSNSGALIYENSVLCTILKDINFQNEKNIKCLKRLV